MMNQELIDYLRSQEFGTWKTFSFEGIGYEGNREDYLFREVINTDVRVVHLGACDHLSSIDKIIANGTWFHKNLMDHAKDVIGIDIDQKAVLHCNKIGYDNIYQIDISTEHERAKCLL